MMLKKAILLTRSGVELLVSSTRFQVVKNHPLKT